MQQHQAGHARTISHTTTHTDAAAATAAHTPTPSDDEGEAEHTQPASSASVLIPTAPTMPVEETARIAQAFLMPSLFLAVTAMPVINGDVSKAVSLLILPSAAPGRITTNAHYCVPSLTSLTAQAHGRLLSVRRSGTY